MEAPLKMKNSTEEEEVVMMGVDLKTRRTSHSHHHHHNHKHHITSPTSSESSITSESSEGSFQGVQNEHVNGGSNGQKSTFIEGGSVIEQAQVEAEAVVGNEKEEILEEPIIEENEIVLDSNEVSFSTNRGTNGVYAHQKGDTVAYSVPEGNVGNQETTESNSSLSKSPDALVGLKDLETLLDESSNNLDIAATDAYNALEDTLNNTFEGVERENGQLGLSKVGISEIQEIDVERVQNENGHLEVPDEPLPEVEEFDVERVVQKQETHDFYCPNCNSCITKRVILKRRKRKIQEISSGDDISTFNPAQPGIREPPTPPPVDDNADGSIQAITCLSCFSIFIPTQNGWLCRIFGRKPEVQVPSDDSLTEPLVPSPGGVYGGDVDVGKGNVFPLWIVNCCQPSEKMPIHLDIPVTPKPEPRDPEGQSEEPSLPPKSEPAVKPGTQPFKPIEPVPSEPYHPGLPDDTPLPPGTDSNAGKHLFQPIPPTPPEPQHPAVSNDEPLPPAPKPPQNEPVPPVPRTDDAPLLPAPKPASENQFALWFLNCCQPHGDGAHVPGKQDPPSSPKTEPTPGEETPIPSRPRSPITPGPDTPLPPQQGPPKTPGQVEPLLPAPILPLRPDEGDVIIPIPPDREGGKASPPTTAPGDTQPEAEPLIDNIVTLPTAPRHPQPEGGAGVSVVKAIVYGGLLECITSLSVITSAAGGDATTLNIVALGLANVFGGFILLFHNLRVLKHEHGTERYIEQLGQPGHFGLHATVAVISYLIFGLMAPVLYGFTFRASDKKDYKLITLAAVSLFCITLLSAAKASVRRPPKAYIQTVLYYFNLGFTVSGIGYVSGHFINMLLKKLGVFDERSALAAVGDMNGIWASY